VLRLQPGIAVIAPADREQTRSALLATWDLPGPVYYRLGKADETVIPGLCGRFELGRAQTIREGDDLLIITMGSSACDVVSAADALAGQGVSSSVVVAASLSPAPIDDLLAILPRFPVLLTVEAHYVVGGLGSLVCEVVSQHGLGCRVVRCGIRTMPDGRTGSQSYMHRVSYHPQSGWH
jgi:transketolase